MEFEPMLTPREKSPLPENVPRGVSNPRHFGSEPKHYQLSYSGPRSPNINVGPQHCRPKRYIGIAVPVLDRTPEICVLNNGCFGKGGGWGVFCFVLFFCFCCCLSVGGLGFLFAFFWGGGGLFCCCWVFFFFFFF